MNSNKMSGGWDEIQRLAADLQRAQLSTGAVKLSERNCVEIVAKLVSLGLIDVIYTTDGKEYLTHQQLQKEISDEVYINGGRLELPELANLLNVDFSQVEAQANQLVKHDSKRLFLVLGQLINSQYLDKIAEEINDKLQLEGTVSISVITKDYNLPSDFVFEQLVSRIGSIIEGFQDPHDPKVIVTQAYVARNKAKIRAVLRAITVPTAVNVICNRFQLEPRLFFRLCDELVKEGAAAGVLTGGRSTVASKATYVPHVYAKAQSDWVDSFYAQNGYLEYDALRRLGIADPVGYAKRRLADEEDVTYLATCCVGKTITDGLEANVEEAVYANGSFVDVMPFLPSVLSDEDTELLINTFVVDGKKSGGSSGGKKRVSSSSAGKTPVVLAETVVTCQAFIDRLVEPFKDKIDEKAAKAVNSGEYGKATKVAAETKDFSASAGVPDVDKKEERRKKAAGGGKAGGGAQGREGKTKSTKNKKANKKAAAKDDWDSDNEEGGSKSAASVETPEALRFMSSDEVRQALAAVSVLQDCHEEFIDALGSHLAPTLNKMYLAAAEELHRSSVSSSIQKKRKTHAEFQERTLALYDNVRLFEKGLGSLKNPGDKSSLEKYLVKSLCSDLVNGVFVHVAAMAQSQQQAEVNSEQQQQQLNSDQRVKLLGQIPKETAEHLLPIHKALASNSVPELLASLEDHLHDACDVLIKKVDKKKDKQLVFAHRQSLLEQIEGCDDPSQLLLLACLVIFQFQSGQMLHASGKFVPSLVSQISDQLESPEDGEVLKKYQALVIDKMHLKAEDQDKLSDIQKQLEELTPKVKLVATNVKKPKN